ncbi:MAG: branched-chain amino acid transaminase [Chloroflexi bacterium]|nr:branched-chain amino acid transaminase [Chloroflexota bacterium]
MNLRSEFIWMDGKVVPYDDATIHINTTSLHYGYGAFEGIRAYKTDNGPAVFRLQDHLERFLNSAKVLGVRDFPFSVDELRQATHKVIRKNGFQSCYIRPLLYFTGIMGLNLDPAEPHVSISTWDWGTYLGDGALEAGVHMGVSSFTRHHVNITMTKAKITGNYANSVLAKTESERNGFDEAIMLDPDGYVAECSGENLFLVKKGIIYTPPRAAILEGITRDSLITLAADLGYPVMEEVISRDQLYIADEVFACGTAAEVTPVTMIDHRPVGDGRKGAVTESIQNEFFQTVAGNGKRSPEWLDIVKIPAPVYSS